MSLALGVFIYSASPVQASICTYGGGGNVTGTACSLTGGSGQICPAVGLNWFLGSGCVSDAALQTQAQSCYSSRRKFDGVTGCTSSCNVSGEILCGTVCQASAPTTTCDAQSRNINACTSSCTTCKSGYTDIGGTCVLSCDPNTQLRTSTGCVSLESVSTRVGSLEGLQICHFDASGAYVNDSGAACPQTFDPTSLNGQLSVAQTRIQALLNVVIRLLPVGDPRDLLSAILTGTGNLSSAVSDFMYALNTLGDINSPTSPLAVALANAVNGGSGAGGGGGGTAAVFDHLSATVRLIDLNNVTNGGYLNANNNFCSGGGMHICSAQEIINSYENGVSAVTNATGVAWINNGPPAHTDTFVNDCGGWTSKDPAQYGAVWNFTSRQGGIQPCNAANHGFACCR